MSLIDRILAEPELRDAPPVLVDVGAAGGVHPAWRRIARYAIGVGFEPDAREAAALGPEQSRFRRWIYCRSLVVPAAGRDTAEIHLTRSPQCSSTLRPRTDRLAHWAFADFFEVVETRVLPATTLSAALTAVGLDYVDWLKCDTQGLDLGIFQSLSAEWRSRLLAVEFEPGLIDAYEGEDKLPGVLAAMEHEPFWLADLQIGRMARGGRKTFEPALGRGAASWVRRLGPAAPAWANVSFLRDVSLAPASFDRRALLLGWVFATMAGQHGYALEVAEAGRSRMGGALFVEMTAASVSRLRWAMVRNFPGWLWRRLWRAG